MLKAESLNGGTHPILMSSNIKSSILSTVYDHSFAPDDYMPVNSPLRRESVRLSPKRGDDFDPTVPKPGSYISQEERTFFERCQRENIKEDLDHYEAEVSNLQHQLRRSM